MSRASLLRMSLAAAALAAFSCVARAEDPHTFVMPDDDAYGVGDCLAAGLNSSCGRVVADAWCESKGFAKAKLFGRADMEDVTGSVPSAPPVVAATPAKARRTPGLVSITCQD